MKSKDTKRAEAIDRQELRDPTGNDNDVTFTVSDDNEVRGRYPQS